MLPLIEQPAEAHTAFLHGLIAWLNIGSAAVEPPRPVPTTLT